jgi:hypothetical protein
MFGLYTSELPDLCLLVLDHGGRMGQIQNNIIHATAIEKLPGEWQAIVMSAQELGKSAYSCNLQACHPDKVLFAS